MEQEKSRYDLHQNDPTDGEYRNFLSQILDPLLANLQPNSKGLDFGSGPGPTLAIMLNEKGHDIEIYDPFYHDYPDKLDRRYDFLTCTEVVEHFGDPARSWMQIKNAVKTGGIIGVMTSLFHDNLSFENWYYKNDLTHVAFYCEYTFKKIANMFDFEICQIDNPVVIFKHG
ncbi:MAG: class I SAM-dependent methyltransferase [Gammaproteobacteria bacterium]